MEPNKTAWELWESVRRSCVLSLVKPCKFGNLGAQKFAVERVREFLSSRFAGNVWPDREQRNGGRANEACSTTMAGFSESFV